MIVETIATSFKEARIKAASGLVLTAFAMFAGMWAFSSHFASAAEFAEFKTEQKTLVKAQSLDTKIQLNKQYIRDLNGKVADIEDKKNLNDTDKTRKQRLQREIADISKENEVLTEQKFKIENGK
jgi:TolA-binding protein